MALQFLSVLYLDPLYYVLSRPERFVLTIYVDDITLWTILHDFEINKVQFEVKCEGN